MRAASIPVMSILSMLALASSVAVRASPIVIGLVPDSDPVRMQELVRGAEWAAERFASELRLVVGRGPGHWGGLTAVIEELITGEGAMLLIAPSDRRGAHLVAQIATRRHLPAIATSSIGDIGHSGSYWLITCRADGEETSSLERRLGRPPLEGELAGWSAVVAARSLLAGVRRGSSPIDITWRERLPARCRDIL